jgi:hypothetical protein
MTRFNTNPTTNMFGQEIHSRTWNVERAVDHVTGINRYTRSAVTFEIAEIDGLRVVVIWDDIPTYREAQLMLVGVEKIIGPNGALAVALGSEEWAVGVLWHDWLTSHVAYWLMACALQVIMAEATSYDFWNSGDGPFVYL